MDSNEFQLKMEWVIVTEDGKRHLRMLWSTPGGPNMCQIVANIGGTLHGEDKSIFMQYDMELGSQAASTAVANYEAF